MDRDRLELPLEIVRLQGNFPRGIYELQTDAVDYEVVLDPMLNYIGALLVDQDPGVPDQGDGKRLSLVGLNVAVGYPAEFVVQNETLELKVRRTAPVKSIQLIELLEG